MSDKAFLVDTTKCQGCRACQVACKQWNGLPGQETDFFAGPEYTNPGELSAITWNHVMFSNLEKVNTDRPVWSIRHKKCYHCDEANCIAVCPEKAISKVDGWTIIDQSKCIGCGSCTEACVYNVPHVSDVKHVNDSGLEVVIKDKAHKCNACTIFERDIPACVNTCPSYALSIGNRNDILQKANKRVEIVKGDFPNASVYGKEEFGGLRVITILRDKPEKFKLPVGDKAKQVEVSRFEGTRDIYNLLSIFTLGFPSFKRVAYKIAKSITLKDV